MGVRKGKNEQLSLQVLPGEAVVLRTPLLSMLPAEGAGAQALQTLVRAGAGTGAGALHSASSGTPERWGRVTQTAQPEAVVAVAAGLRAGNRLRVPAK